MRWWASALLLPWLPVSAADLRLHLRDESGRPVTARLEIHAAANGNAVMVLPPNPAAAKVIPSRPAGRPNTGSPYLGSFVLRESDAVIPVPAPGRYRIVAEHGLEYERLERVVDVPAAGADVTLRLRPWVRMNARGWWSGDMHVHRPMEDVPALATAEALDFAVVFTMWNRTNLWSGGKPFPTAQDWIRPAGPGRWMTVTNAEDERGGGAWMLHGLKEPLGIEDVLNATARATESWDPPGIEFVRKARRQKSAGGTGGALFPWFDLEKPIWWEAPVMMALERPDSMGLLHNHYDQYGMYDNEAWGRKRDTARFPGPDGFSDYSLHLMYRYWNLGWLVTPTAGAASGVLPNPVGYNRTYVKLDGEFTVEKWYEGLRRGGPGVMVSNGPLVLFAPKLSAAAGQSRVLVEGTIEVIARDPLRRVELVASGQVIQTWQPGAGKKRFRTRLKNAAIPPGANWVAVRAYAVASAAPTVRLGHTAPLRLSPGPAATARDDARYFREWIEELRRNPKTPPGSRAAALYDEALAVYRAFEAQ